MNKRKHWMALGGSLMLGLAGAATADTASGDADLRAELEALRARIGELEAKQNDTWLSQRRAEEVKALVSEVLADADTRSSFANTAMVAGHDDKGFFLASEDGNFLLRSTGYIQFRYIYNDRDGADHVTPGAPNNDDREFGFEIRRAKIGFEGHIGTPKITYVLVIAADRNTETIFLDQAQIGYQWMDGVWIYGGEAKGPFLREELVSAKHLLAVERSLVNEFFTIGRIQGVWANIDVNDYTKLALSVNDGFNSGEAGDDSDGHAEARKRFDSDASDVGLTARLDVRLAGNWEQWDDFSAWSDEETAIFLGAAIHYELEESGDGQTSSVLSSGDAYNNILIWTVDGSVECNGCNVFGSFSGASVNGAGLRAGGEPTPNTTHYGALIQGGYMVIPDRLEPFVRYEWLDPDESHDVNLVTVGANYYIKKHKAKFTADLVFVLNSLDDVPDFVGTSGLGLLQDNPEEDGQIVLRTQFQLVY